MLDGMHNAVIIYNPWAGSHRHRRLEELATAQAILKEGGIEAELQPTRGRGTATELARQAVEQARDLVIVCGGDGTINEAVNGLARSQVPLAVLPAGTANVLAKELGLPWDIPAAARLIPKGTLRRIALGMIVPLGSAADAKERYFLCVGGAGPDGAIVHSLNETLKLRTGILADWVEGLWQALTYTFPAFRITSEGRQISATFLVVGRAKHYGGPFCITTGASLFEDTFELLACPSRNAFRYLIYFTAMSLGRLRNARGVKVWKATQVRCEPSGRGKVCAQVDGEASGTLPAEFRIVPDALTLVVPETAQGPGS